MIIIGDVHGCYKTLVALLEKLPDDRIIFVGDLIDRGPRSKDVVQLIIDNPKMRCVRGNHEQIMLDTEKDIHQYAWSIQQGFRSIGGRPTVESYYPDKDPACIKFLPELKKDYPSHYDFFNNLPIFIEEGNLFVSHSSYDVYESWNILEQDTHGEDCLLWHRGVPCRVKRGSREMFHVFGHTPQEGGEDVTDYYANVDTGAFYKKIGLGFLTAIQYPSKKVFCQINID